MRVDVVVPLIVRGLRRTLFGVQRPLPERLISTLSDIANLGDFGSTATRQWIAVRQRFQHFNANIQLLPTQKLDGYGKRDGVVSCLNRAYYGSTSTTDNSFFVGSWGKDTAVRPPRDVDIYFELPDSVYARFAQYIGNRQSALLQEVKNILAVTYPSTEMRGDGQVVIVRFSSYNVEVVPAFRLQQPGQYWICDTNGGGRYKTTHPITELWYFDGVDAACAKNLRPLVRMLKTWQTHCSVPLKSFELELVAADFLSQYADRLNDFFWFDWFMRDFFRYLISRSNSFLALPGTGELIWLGDDWRSKAESALGKALKACDEERDNYVIHAGQEWQKIFGQDIPLNP